MGFFQVICLFVIAGFYHIAQGYCNLGVGEICCNDTVYSEYTRKGKVVCCNDELLKDAVWGCCGNKPFQKNGNMSCCGFQLYPKNSSALCCEPELYFNANQGDRCCVDKKIAADDCCIQHDEPADKCCGNEKVPEGYYCDHNLLSLTPFNHKYCNGDLYNFMTDICCNDNISLNTDGDSGCCEEKLFRRKVECCGDKPVNDTFDACCKNEIGGDDGFCCVDGDFIKPNMRCCNFRLYSTFTHRSCYNTNGDCYTIPKDEKCCRPGTTSGNAVCCGDFFVPKQHRDDNACCSSAYQNQKQGLSYNNNTHECQQIPTLKIIHKCGQDFNDEHDLCCNGKLHRNARLEGKECCGKHVCCDGNRIGSKSRCPENPVPFQSDFCSLFCSGNKARTMQAIISRELNCRRNILVGHIRRTHIMTSEYEMLYLDGVKRLSFSKTPNSIQQSPRVKEIILDCECQPKSRKIIVLTDQSIIKPERLLRLSTLDVIIPFSPKIRNKLKEWHKIYCQKPPVINEQFLDSIYEFILYKLQKENGKKSDIN